MVQTIKIIVKLTPGAGKNDIQICERDLLGDLVLPVRVTAIPEKGKANQALVKLLAKSFHMSKSSFTILRGETSRTKLISISDPSPTCLTHLNV